jgi:hypothetical protein
MPASPRSDGVRVHPGTPFGLPPEYAFSFPGIPSERTRGELVTGTTCQYDNLEAAGLLGKQRAKPSVSPSRTRGKAECKFLVLELLGLPPDSKNGADNVQHEIARRI